MNRCSVRANAGRPTKNEPYHFARLSQLRRSRSTGARRSGTRSASATIKLSSSRWLRSESGQPMSVGIKLNSAKKYRRLPENYPAVAYVRTDLAVLSAHLFAWNARRHIPTSVFMLLNTILSTADLRWFAGRRITEFVRCFRIALAPFASTVFGSSVVVRAGGR